MGKPTVYVRAAVDGPNGPVWEVGSAYVTDHGELYADSDGEIVCLMFDEAGNLVEDMVIHVTNVIRVHPIADLATDGADKVLTLPQVIDFLNVRDFENGQRWELLGYWEEINRGA